MAQGHHKRRLAAILLAAAGLGLVPGLAARAQAAPVRNGASWALEEKALYKVLPNATLEDADGTTRHLAEWSSQGPLLVTFAYARCTGVCSPLLRNLDATTRQLGGIGQRYRVLVVDLDPADRPEILRAFARSQGVRGDGWSFATSPDVEALTRALGAWARPLPGGQIEHPPLVGAVRNGRLVQLVSGADFSAERLGVAIAEAHGAFVPVYPVPGSDVRLRCFHYAPDRAGFGLDWGFLLLVIPMALAFGATLFIFKPRRRPKHP